MLREYRDLSIGKTARSQLVTVIGAGPAGLEAALQADQRGHQVILYEKLPEVGGALRLAAIPSFKGRMRKLLEHYEERIAKSDVSLVTSFDINQENLEQIIKDKRPDLVVFSTGGNAPVPAINGVDNNHVYSAEEVLLNYEALNLGRNVVVIGAGKVGLEIGWMLADLDKRVVVIENMPYAQILADDHPMVKSSLLHNLKIRGITLMGGCRVQKICSEGQVEVQLSDGSSDALDADSVVLATGYKPNNSLAGFYNNLDLSGTAYELGDCKKVRGLFNAIHEGYYLGRYIL